ncbi:MAG: hypothetical protein ABI629_22825 [bacterium]
MIEDAVEVGVFPGIHHAVAVEIFFDALEQDLRLERVWIVGVVAARAIGDVVERAAVDVDRHRNAGLEIDDVDGVAREVGLAEAAASLPIEPENEVNLPPVSQLS